MDAPLSPSTLFSPSRALASTRQSHTHALLTTWLTQFYPRGPPSYELNDSTLSALLALSTYNERADVERGLQVAARKSALREEEGRREGREGGLEGDVLELLEGALGGEGGEALDALSRAAVQLDLPSSDVRTTDIAFAATDLSFRVHELQEQLAHITALQQSLEKEHEKSEALLNKLKTEEAYTAPAHLPRETADLTRQSKALAPKIAEYRSRVDALPTHTPSSKQDALCTASIMSIVQQEADILELERTVASLEASAEKFADLGHDKQSAEKELRRLEALVSDLRDEREELIKGMVDTR